MDSLRERKKGKLMEDEAFTYMISSQEKTNINVNQSPTLWEFDFGNFESPYEDYKIEVINCAHNGFVLASNVFYMLVCEGLTGNNGNFFRKKLSNREVVLSVLPLNAISDSYIQTEGSTGTTFTVQGCRIKKTIRCYFLKPDFTPLIDATDINVGGTSHWFVTFKVTPISYN